MFVLSAGVLSIAEFLFVFGQLPFQPVDAAVNAGVGIFLGVVSDEHITVLGADDHLDSHGILGAVEDDFDFLDAIVISGEFIGFLLGVGLERSADIHVPRRDSDQHAS